MIATEWISHYPSKELVGKYATFKGRPVIGIDKARPDCTTAPCMIAACGESGQLHNYFAEETLEEFGARAGVRADHPVEIVIDAALVAAECCSKHDVVPGAAILYIRDTRSDELLYSASADGPKDEPAKDDEEEDKQMGRPARAVDR